MQASAMGVLASFRCAISGENWVASNVSVLSTATASVPLEDSFTWFLALPGFTSMVTGTGGGQVMVSAWATIGCPMSKAERTSAVTRHRDIRFFIELGLLLVLIWHLWDACGKHTTSF